MEGVAIQSDGKIVAAGYTSKPPSPFDDFVVARFNPDGSADSTIGSGGIVICWTDGPRRGFGDSTGRKDFGCRFPNQGHSHVR